LISFLNIKTGSYREYELTDEKQLNIPAIKSQLSNNLTITFNGIGYDMLMTVAAINGYTNQQLKDLSDLIIMGDDPSWKIQREHDLKPSNNWDHIDLMNVAPGNASLKIYGGRLHSKKLQDLPIEPSEILTDQDMTDIRLYCRNDLLTTLDLYNFLQPQINLRIEMSKQYDLDLRSKSDAQIAEAVLKSEIEKNGGSVSKNIVKPGTSYLSVKT
jgi:hypothetical protein